MKDLIKGIVGGVILTYWLKLVIENKDTIINILEKGKEKLSDSTSAIAWYYDNFSANINDISYSDSLSSCDSSSSSSDGWSSC